MGRVVFGDVDRCSYCRGRGTTRRGGKMYTCRRCSGVGMLDRESCWCQCGCKSFTTMMICSECIESALDNGCCMRAIVIDE
jgi:hypothetical protein